MDNKIFESNRYFILFDYYPSHGQLLIRSQITDEYSKNMDLIFFDVDLIQIPTNFFGLNISKIEGDKSLYIEFSKKNSSKNLYSLNKLSHVLASSLKIYKNELSFNESSLGLTNVKGRENEIFSL